MKKFINPLFLSIFIVFVSLIALKSYRTPEYNWDMIAYMAVILSYDHPDKDFIHQEVYSTIRKEVPPKEYFFLIDSSNKYRTSVRLSSEIFWREMPYYQVKPAYTYVAYAAYKSGIPLTRATVVPSILGFIGVAILTLLWLSQFLKASLAVVFSSIIISFPFVNHATKLSTPDMLSAFVLFASFLMLLHKKQLLSGILLLLLSILIRLDNILPALVLLSSLFIYRKHWREISLMKYILFSITALILYFSVTLTTNWSPLYFTDFINKLTPTGGFKNYLLLLSGQLFAGMYYSSLAYFSLVLILILVTKQGLPSSKYFIGTVLIILVSRTLLHPAISDRFYIPYYLITLMLLLKTFSPHFKPRLLK